MVFHVKRCAPSWAGRWPTRSLPASRPPRVTPATSTSSRSRSSAVEMPTTSSCPTLDSRRCAPSRRGAHVLRHGRRPWGGPVFPLHTGGVRCCSCTLRSAPSERRPTTAARSAYRLTAARRRGGRGGPGDKLGVAACRARTRLTRPSPTNRRFVPARPWTVPTRTAVSICRMRRSTSSTGSAVPALAQHCRPKRLLAWQCAAPGIVGRGRRIRT